MPTFGERLHVDHPAHPNVELLEVLESHRVTRLIHGVARLLRHELVPHRDDFGASPPAGALPP